MLKIELLFLVRKNVFYLVLYLLLLLTYQLILLLIYSILPEYGHSFMQELQPMKLICFFRQRSLPLIVLPCQNRSNPLPRTKNYLHKEIITLIILASCLILNSYLFSLWVYKFCQKEAKVFLLRLLLYFLYILSYWFARIEVFI